MENNSPAGLPFAPLDAASSSPRFPCGYCRILVQPSQVKYLAYPESTPAIPDIPGLLQSLSGVPNGEWNVGYLERNSQAKEFQLVRTEQRELASVTSLWHPQRVDRSSLGPGSPGANEAQGRRQMYSVVHYEHFDHAEVIVSVEWHPDDIYGVVHETAIYAMIEGHSIGPAFLAHVTENYSRVIGYMCERVSGRRPRAEDGARCEAVLARLHGLGIAHGCLEAESFIVSDGRVVLHGFGGSYKTTDPGVLEGEMQLVRELLGGGASAEGVRRSHL